MCDLPRLEESQRRLVINTLGQSTTPTLAEVLGMKIQKIRKRSTIRTRVVTVFNKSGLGHNTVLVNHSYIDSHNETGQDHETGQVQTMSAIDQDKITQVP